MTTRVPNAMISWATGTLTLSATAANVVPNTNTTATSTVVLTPTNAAAANLMAGAKSLYLSARSVGVSFTLTTADGNAAAGTETFSYTLIN